MAKYPPGQPSVRSVAKAAGVSAMTVSLALRNHPRIPPATRAAVQKVAAKLGYRPDPNIAKLMHLLRAGSRPGYQASIMAITNVREGADSSYLNDIRQSAQRRAEELGYGFSVWRLSDAPNSKAALQRVFRSRGIEGIMILPMATPRDVTEVIGWDEFSVVSASYSILAPDFHRIVPHQFGNALELCQQLTRRGYRRIGLVLPAEQDIRVHHGFSAAVAWQSLDGGTELVRSCIHEGTLPPAAMLRAWFARERPDVIIAGADKECVAIAAQLKLSVPGPVAFASTTRTGHSVFAGIDERPAEIGSAAIEQLAAMIQRGEKGTPATPKVTMITGRWIDGASAKARKPRRLPLRKPPELGWTG